MRSSIAWVNVGLRALMETGILAGFAVWGYQTANGGLAGALLGVVAVVVGFGFWGLVDFHQAGPWAEWLRLGQEIVVSGLAALAWWAVDVTAVGLALALISLVYHVLVYVNGERLLGAAEPLAS